MKLDLSNNEIATAEIRENSKLADMDVSHNKISGSRCGRSRDW